MFGLEGDKKKTSEEFIFDLEKELKDHNRQVELLEHVKDRLETIKKLLRKGEDQESFQKLGILLQGYSSLLKMLGRRFK